MLPMPWNPGTSLRVYGMRSRARRPKLHHFIVAVRKVEAEAHRTGEPDPVFAFILQMKRARDYIFIFKNSIESVMESPESASFKVTESVSASSSLSVWDAGRDGRDGFPFVIS